MVGRGEWVSEVEDPGRCDAIMAVERNVQEVLQTVLQRQKAVHWKEAGRERESGEACGLEAMGETHFQTCDWKGARRGQRHVGVKRGDQVAAFVLYTEKGRQRRGVPLS